MENKLEEIKNLSLEIVCEKPRLQATFGEFTNTVLAKITEISDTGADIIKSHFATLPFVLKTEEYWSKKSKELILDGKKLMFTPFQFDYIKWNSMLGIKTIPDSIVLNDVVECLKSSFGIHNEESITEAIKMNLRATFPSVVEPFGQINRVYLSKLLVYYEKKLKEDLRIAYILRDNLKMENTKQVENTPEYAEEKLRKSILEVFSEYKKQNNNSVELISYVIYDYLDSKKILNISPSEKKSLMNEANSHIVFIEQKATQKGLISKAIKYDNVAVVSMAKRLAVRNFFNSINELSI